MLWVETENKGMRHKNEMKIIILSAHHHQHNIALYKEATREGK